MSNCRKRRSSEDLENDSKRVSYDRRDVDSYIKKEYNPHGVRTDYTSVSYKDTPVRIQSAVYEPQRYFNYQYVDKAYKNEKANAITSPSNLSSYQDAITMYDERRQMNFQYVHHYLNSLRQSDSRHVNFNDLKHHLSDIDIRCLSNWKFVTAYDLSQELESSLKYFIDTRNELIFLRKLHRHQLLPFSYNEMNITNTTGLYNRMTFLENESSYRSHRMNQLFSQLQSVVIPSVIDDIRYVHSVSYEKSWVNRARYWFHQFKQIKWDKGFRFNDRQTNYRAQKHQRSESNHRGYKVKDEYDVTSTVDIKSEVVIKPHVKAIDGKIDQNKKVEKNSHNQQASISNTAEKSIQPNGCNIVVHSEKKQCGETANDPDESLVLVEPNISVVTVVDDDNVDSINNAVPAEGDITN